MLCSAMQRPTAYRMLVYLHALGVSPQLNVTERCEPPDLFLWSQTHREKALSAMANDAAPTHVSASGCATDRPPLRLVLFGARRTGSSLFVNLMRQHPRVLMHGEV